MSRQKYYYNKQTLSYEVCKTPLGVKFFRVFGILSAILITAIALFAVFYAYFPSQKERALIREIDEMQFHYDNLLAELDVMSDELTNIQARDAQVHRFMFDMDPIEPSVWHAGVGGSDRYSALGNFENGGQKMVETHEALDKLKRQLELQARSLDTIEYHAMVNADKIESIPSIKPVRVDLLKRNVTLLSGFGMRLHPIHKVQKMHEGIDFTAPIGTDIQATGKGTVIAVRNNEAGYGRYVIIEHGYGYRSLYGHMDKISVKVGQKVSKGQAIGTVGNTGTSTAPHCHYEVHVNGHPVDPIDYCLDGLTPAQYKEVVKRASSASQSFD